MDDRQETPPKASRQRAMEDVDDSVSLAVNRGTQPTESQSLRTSAATASCASPSATVTSAEKEWMQYVLDIYPNLSNGANFFPPLHFNKVPWTVIRREQWEEYLRTSTQPALAAVVGPGTRGWPSQSASSNSTTPEKVSGMTFTAHGELLRPPSYQTSDSQDDMAQSTVRLYLEKLGNTEAMMVVSQLQYKKYLCKGSQDSQLPRSDGEGDWDVIIIHRRYGVIWGEVKSVGRANPYFRDANEGDRRTMIVTQMAKALTQMKRQEEALTKLVSDLRVKLTKTLFFPFVTSGELSEALEKAENAVLRDDMRHCLGTTNVREAVRRCLCWNDVKAAGIIGQIEAAELELPDSTKTDSQATNWWQDTVAGVDQNMSEDDFLRLVGRFCGPATEVEIPTICGPRHRKVLRSEGEAVAETGLIMSRLSLHREQVDVLVNTPEEDSVYLCGPPGTGKTVVLVLKAQRMLRNGYDVHILSSSPDSAAVTALIHHQLTELSRSPVSVITGEVYRHLYDLTTRESLDTAVDELAGRICSPRGRVFLLVDEITYHVMPNIANFLERLYQRMSDMQLTVWGAGVYSDDPLPDRLIRKELNIALRCPPNIHREVRQSERIGGSGHLIPRYEEGHGIPASTEGPGVKWLTHQGQAGHSQGDPEHCLECGRVVARWLQRLDVGKQGSPLQWNDVFILSDRLLDHCSPLLQGLREHEVPVTFVPRNADQTMITALATANNNTVTLTDIYTVSGLERRLVVGMGNSGFSRCGAMSRCTSQLFWIDRPATV